MMPTTRAASTPSRSATRNAESTDDPVCPVVSNLQLQIRVYLSRTFQVNRTNSVRFPPGRNRLFCFLHMATLRQASSLTLSSLVLFSQLSFAQSQPPAAQAPAERVRPDPKRARKAAEQGEKAEAAGHLEDALAAYEEAAHYAPKEIAFAERAAGLRSKLVRSYADEAERDAIAGRLEQATEDLAAALAIDPSNPDVMERLRQIKSMADETEPKAVSEIPDLPRLRPQAGKRNLDLRGDTRTVYEQLAGIFGLRVSFDPDLIIRNVRLNLNDVDFTNRSEEHTSELQSRLHLVCRLLLEKKKKQENTYILHTTTNL